MELADGLEEQARLPDPRLADDTDDLSLPPCSARAAAWRRISSSAPRPTKPAVPPAGAVVVGRRTIHASRPSRGASSTKRRARKGTAAPETTIAPGVSIATSVLQDRTTRRPCRPRRCCAWIPTGHEVVGAVNGDDDLGGSPGSAARAAAARWIASAARAAWLGALSTGSRPNTAMSPRGPDSSIRPPKLSTFSAITSSARALSRSTTGQEPGAKEGEMAALPPPGQTRGATGPRRRAHGAGARRGAGRTCPCGRGGYCGRCPGRRRCGGCCRRSRAAPPRCASAACRPASRRAAAPLPRRRPLGGLGVVARNSSIAAVITSVSESSTTRSIALASSRTLPGHR